MGRKRQLLMQYQPTAGVNQDFEQILQRFTAVETVRFEKFAEIWRVLKMSYIFAGRDSERECREYTEEILRMALKYVLPPYNFQIRVGGLYLLYGLYNLQPLIRRVRIRVTPDKWKEIVEFQKEARRQQHLDVNYVFHKLRFDDAFNFVATDTEVAFYLSTLGNIKEEDTAPDEFKDEQSVLYELFSDQFLEQLSQLHEHYHRVKVGLEGPDATEPSRSLNVIQTNIVPSVLGTVVAYQQRKQHHHSKKPGISDTEQEETEHEDNTDVKNSNIKSHLKAKAYRNIAKANRSRRHRQAVESAEESPEKSPSKGRRKKSVSEEEVTSPPKKRKVGRKKKVKIEEVMKEEKGEEETNDKESIKTEIANMEQVCEVNTTEKNNQDEVNTTEKNNQDILHMPSFEIEPSCTQISPQKSGTPSCTQISPQKSGTPKVKKSKKKGKVIKGKMPSVKLQPLQKKKKKTSAKKNQEKDEKEDT